MIEFDTLYDFTNGTFHIAQYQNKQFVQYVFSTYLYKYNLNYSIIINLLKEYNNYNHTVTNDIFFNNEHDAKRFIENVLNPLEIAFILTQKNSKD